MIVRSGAPPYGPLDCRSKHVLAMRTAPLSADFTVRGDAVFWHLGPYGDGVQAFDIRRQIGARWRRCGYAPISASAPTNRSTSAASNCVPAPARMRRAASSAGIGFW